MSPRARWVRWRNARLSSAGFQRWAAAFPLTRPRARAEAAALFDLVAGFVHAQVLACVVELDLCKILARGPLGEAALAAQCDLPTPSMRRLLRAAAALGLVEPLGDAWALGPRGAALHGNPGVAAMVAHHREFYADMADPVALLRRGGGGGALARYWGYARNPAAAAAADDRVAAYSTLMATSQPMVAAQVVAAYDFARHRRLLDIGGGEGAFVRAVAAAAPRVELALFDLPAVVVRARVALGASGLDRVATHGGSFFDDALPTGYDVVTLVRILHDHDDAAVLLLLRRFRATLAPGATLIIAEPMAGDRPGRVADAYFGFYLLAMGSGRARSANELRAMLAATGFAASRLVPTPLPLVTSLIVAKA